MKRALLFLTLLAASSAAGAQPGWVLDHQKISADQGGFVGTLSEYDQFGRSIALLGDLDGDGIEDLAVGASGDDDGGTDHGAVWVLFLNADGTVRAHQKISSTQGGFTGTLGSDAFGASVAALGDLDGDGVTDLAVGAIFDNDVSAFHGAVWVLFLNGDGTVRAHQKISERAGGFTGNLDDGDHFGWSVASLGDLDGDGVTDLAVGAAHDDDGGNNHGAVWVLFLNSNGTVKAHQKISDTEGGFTGTLYQGDYFGMAAEPLGDFDGDGVTDLAVGAGGDRDGGFDHGAVWLLFLNADGTVKGHQKISDREGGFTGDLDDADHFGRSIALLGDLDGDGIEDLAVGAIFDDDGGEDHGAVWVLFLNADGTVRAHQKISSTEGGFAGVLDDSDYFGASVAALGDLDGDGVTDLAAGAPGDDDGGTDRGAVWVLFLNEDGTVKGHQKISDTEGGFIGVLDDHDHFGSSVASLGDLDGDGVTDLAVGAINDDDDGTDRGAVWVLFLNPQGTVKDHQKISSTEGGFTGTLADGDAFGSSVVSLGDLDSDGVTDLAVGAMQDDDGGTDHGAVWVLFLNPNGTVRTHQKISDAEGGFAGVLDDGDTFGSSVAALGTFDFGSTPDLAVGAPGDDDRGTDRGAVWMLFLNEDGTVRTYQKISDSEGGFTLPSVLDDGDAFGSSVAALGDLDGDGVTDLAVGAINDDDDGTDRGAVWVLFMGEASELTLTPLDPPVVVPAEGGAFTFTVTVTNHTDEPLTLDAWVEATQPDGTVLVGPYGPLRGPVTVVVYPSQTLERTLVQRAPAEAMTGEWTYTGYVGIYPDGAVTFSGFAVTKEGAVGRAAPARRSARTSSDVATWQMVYAADGRPVAPGDVWTAGDGPAATASAGADLAATYALRPAYPNPSSQETTLGYDLPRPSHVRLVVYDLLGRQVAVLVDGEREAGWHAAHLDASGLAAGTYLYRLTAGDFHATGRLTVVR